MSVVLTLLGASNRTIQASIASFVDRWSARGVKIVGALELHETPERGTAAVDCLQDIATGRLYPLYQQLGPGSESCRLTGAGIVEACEELERQVAAGCDLVVLSKFGKLEAMRSGLIAAFSAAIGAGLPVLTAVAPRYDVEWHRFAGDLATTAVPDAMVMDDWWLGSSREHSSAKVRF